MAKQVYGARYSQAQHLWARLRLQRAICALVESVGGFDGIEEAESWESVLARAQEKGFRLDDKRWAPADAATAAELEK